MKCVKTTQENNTEITRNKKIKNTGKFGKGNNTDIMLKCCLSVGIIKRNCERFVEGIGKIGGDMSFYVSTKIYDLIFNLDYLY